MSASTSMYTISLERCHWDVSLLFWCILQLSWWNYGGNRQGHHSDGAEGDERRTWHWFKVCQYLGSAGSHARFRMCLPYPLLKASNRFLGNHSPGVFLAPTFWDYLKQMFEFSQASFVAHSQLHLKSSKYVRKLQNVVFRLKLFLWKNSWQFFVHSNSSLDFWTMWY